VDLNLHLAIFYHRVDNGRDLSTSGHLPYSSTSKKATPLLRPSLACYIFQAYLFIKCLIILLFYLTYYSHSTGTTQWVDPRLAQVKKATVDECDDDGKGTTSIYYSAKKKLAIEQPAFCEVCNI